MHFTGSKSDLVDIIKLTQPLVIQTANNVAKVEEAGMVFVTHTVQPQNGKAYEKTTHLQPVYY